MALATEMRNLVENIKDSARDRLSFVKSSQADTHELLAQFDRELREMAKDLKDFLVKSEQARAKSEQARLADFKVAMKDIKGDVRAIRTHTEHLLAEYREDLRGAARAWASLSGRGAAAPRKTAAHHPRRHGGRKSARH